MQQSGGLLLAAGLDDGNALIRSLREQMQTNPSSPTTKRPILSDWSFLLWRRIAARTSAAGEGPSAPIFYFCIRIHPQNRRKPRVQNIEISSLLCYDTYISSFPYLKLRKEGIAVEVTLAQMLESRERRASRQIAMNREFGKPLISFSMNIPGPVKDSPLIRRGFYAGCAMLDAQLTHVLHREITEALTGCEAMYVVDLDPLALKTITTAIEDNHGLGRLFDMDVIGPDLHKLDRETVDGGPRNCIVCGAPGRGCASRRIHSVEQLQAATRQILESHFQAEDAARIGALAVQSLLEEVCTTPKPGLVDRRNSGSHKDMDITTFHASAGALAPYFRSCAAIGMETAGAPAGETFLLLRQAGLQAERDMYKATGGVNTHKGAIFTLGLLCGAAGRLWKPESIWRENPLFSEVAAMTAEAMEADWKQGGNTVGHRLYVENGIRGIRGEVAQGLPSLANIGLPAFRACLEQGKGRNEAGVITLLHLIARVEDTNMIARGGLDLAREGAVRARQLLKQLPTTEQVEELDNWFIQRNLSPGGCADLLAAVYFVHSLTAVD